MVLIYGSIVTHKKDNQRCFTDLMNKIVLSAVASCVWYRCVCIRIYTELKNACGGLDLEKIKIANKKMSQIEWNMTDNIWICKVKKWYLRINLNTGVHKNAMRGKTDKLVALIMV